MSARRTTIEGVLSRRGALGILAAPILRGKDKRLHMFGDAEAYDRFMGRWSHLVAPLLVDFTGIPGTGRVLDVGSGTGSLAFVIAERNMALNFRKLAVH